MESPGIVIFGLKPPHGGVPALKRSVTIAGGGLAGLSLGIALRVRGVSVTLHEATTYPRHKVCGEFISGVTDETLSQLGIIGMFSDAIPMHSACWCDGASMLGEMSVSGRGISRWRLDDMLQKEFVARGGKLFTHSRIPPGPGIIWGVGRARRSSSWLGLKLHLRNISLTHDLEMAIGSNGYVGLSRIEHGRVNVCALFHTENHTGPTISAKGHLLLLEYLRRGGLPLLAERIADADIDPLSFCGVAGFCPGDQKGPLFSIGDASSMIPPFTGNGMSMAFESAECALQPALDYAGGEKDWQEAAISCAKAQKDRFRRRMIISMLMHPLLITPLGRHLTRTLARQRALPYNLLLGLLR